MKEEKQRILDELGGISEGDYDSLVEELISQAEKQIGELKEAIDGGNFERIAKIAHTIKGTSANLRVYKLQELVKSLEFQAKEEKDKNTIAEGLKKIEEALEELKKE